MIFFNDDVYFVPIFDDKVSTFKGYVCDQFDIVRLCQFYVAGTT